MPAALIITGLVTVAAYIAMGPKYRDKFRRTGLSGLFKKDV